MTRKDYVIIAETLATAWWDSEYVKSGVVHTLADALEADNPRFDRARFLTACGVK